MADGVGMGVGVGIADGSGVGEGRGGVLVAVGSCTLIGVRVAVGWGVAVGGTAVGMAVGGVVGMGVDVSGGLGVLVGVGVGVDEELQPLRRGSSTSPQMTQKQRKALVLDTGLTPVICLTSGKGFRIVGHIIAYLPQLDHFWYSFV